MKICWDNLEKYNIHLNKNGKLVGKGNYEYKENCKNCGESFLGQKNNEFCSKTCSTSGEFNPCYKKIYSDKTRAQMSKNRANIFGENNPNYGKKGILNHLYKNIGNLCWYNTHAHKISWVEEVRRALDNENILEVKCKYCGKWHKPTLQQIKNRVKALNSSNGLESYFYCSNECKKACPIFHKAKYPAGFTGDQNSSREVQPELRKLVLERDNYTCQKCGLSSNTSCVELHCHHINPVALDPLESADIDNCITLCKDCHHEAHKKDGCKTGQLSNCINY